jgi:PAS domain S-box-containing protein
MSKGHSTEFVTRTEAALRASEALKSAILETALDCIVTINHEGRVLDFNPAAEKTFGYTRDEAAGHEMAELIIPPELRERHRIGLARAVGTGKDTIVGQRIEITAMRKGGERFPVELAITRISGHGPPIFTGHIRDITERKQAELRRSAQLAITRILAEAPSLTEATPQILRAVCDCLHWDIGTIWHVDGEVLRCVDVWPTGDPRFSQFEDVTRTAVFEQGTGLPGRIWANGEPQWVADVVRDANFPRSPLAKQAGLHGAFGFPIRLGESVLGVIEFFSREIRQPNEDVLELFSTVGGQIGQFIERKRAEEGIRVLNADLERRVAKATVGLRESQERFSKAFRASPVFLSIARMSDGKFVEVNEAFLQSSGYTREEVIGRTSADLKLWHNLADRGSFLFEVQLRGFIRHREVMLCSKDGRRDTVLLSAEVIDIDGQPHILAVGLNITARKKGEEDMRRALEHEKELSRLKTNFVALVSHEFRTPLGVIMSAADILKNYFDRLSAERRAVHLQDIHDASRRMGDLMDEVLLLARVEAGRMECKRCSLDVLEFCRRVAADVRTSTGDACPIQFTAQNVTDAASADESLLRHIFNNLLSNAVKYSAPGRPVSFHVERAGQDAIFVLRDQGIGIPKSDQSNLFLTFHRGTNVGERPGTGLGLVIVKRCVELHGGTVEMQSEEGKGTVVTVRLPLFVPPETEAPSKPQPEPTITGTILKKSASPAPRGARRTKPKKRTRKP